MEHFPAQQVSNPIRTHSSQMRPPARKGVLICSRTVSSSRNPLPFHLQENGQPSGPWPCRAPQPHSLRSCRSSIQNVYLPTSNHPECLRLYRQSLWFTSSQWQLPRLLQRHFPPPSEPFRLSRFYRVAATPAVENRPRPLCPSATIWATEAASPTHSPNQAPEPASLSHPPTQPRRSKSPVASQPECSSHRSAPSTPPSLAQQASKALSSSTLSSRAPEPSRASTSSAGQQCSARRPLMQSKPHVTSPIVSTESRPTSRPP